MGEIGGEGFFEEGLGEDGCVGKMGEDGCAGLDGAVGLRGLDGSSPEGALGVGLSCEAGDGVGLSEGCPSNSWSVGLVPFPLPLPFPLLILLLLALPLPFPLILLVRSPLPSRPLSPPFASLFVFLVLPSPLPFPCIGLP